MNERRLITCKNCSSVHDKFLEICPNCKTANDMVIENYKFKHISKGEDNSLENIEKVRIADLDMPFLSMVKFIVKLTLASIPALIILLLIFTLFAILILRPIMRLLS